MWHLRERTESRIKSLFLSHMYSFGRKTHYHGHGCRKFGPRPQCYSNEKPRLWLIFLLCDTGASGQISHTHVRDSVLILTLNSFKNTLSISKTVLTRHVYKKVFIVTSRIQCDLTQFTFVYVRSSMLNYCRSKCFVINHNNQNK